MDKIIQQPEPDKLKILQHTQYVTGDHLTPANALSAPLDQFRVWFTDAVQQGVQEPEAMALSTATPTGIPSSRMVLLKQTDAKGFVFFTNYTSRKSQEIAANPHAALVFYWRELHRSVRVVGRVEQIDRKESEEYFQSRPVGSQLGAWASKQSSVAAEGAIEGRLEKVKKQFNIHDENSGSVPTPEFWGGWRVIPDEVEFWSGKPSRLHDRIRYLREDTESGPGWKIERLCP